MSEPSDGGLAARWSWLRTERRHRLVGEALAGEALAGEALAPSRQKFSQ
jgi:hypothetical protein